MILTTRAVMLAALVACACPTKQAPITGGSGSGSSVAPGCEGIRAKVEQLYRAEAQAKEPKRVEEAVADNTAMVMNDCAKAPAKMATCVGRVSTVAELEKTCLVQLDDEGSEGEELRK
jgi:hypothetical protein